MIPFVFACGFGCGWIFNKTTDKALPTRYNLTIYSILYSFLLNDRIILTYIRLQRTWIFIKKTIHLKFIYYLLIFVISRQTWDSRKKRHMKRKFISWWTLKFVKSSTFFFYLNRVLSLKSILRKIITLWLCF